VDFAALGVLALVAPGVACPPDDAAPEVVVARVVLGLAEPVDFRAEWADAASGEEADVDDPEGAPLVSAEATPAPLARAISPAANAIPPYPPNFTALTAALRDSFALIGAVSGNTDVGQAGRWAAAIGGLQVI
jgi:hypothetical protein